jgi:hypothetical protein
LFVKEFPEVAVWLDNAGPTTSLDSFLGLQDESLQKWSEQDNAKDLTDLEGKIWKDHADLPTRGDGATRKVQ